MTLRTSNADNWIENILSAVLLLSSFKSTIYSKCLLMQYSILMNLKNQNHPQYQLFVQSPQTFLEVKGEWSLGKVSESIQSFGLHKDIEKSSVLYKLSKSNAMMFDYHEFNSDISKYNNEDKKIISDISLVTTYFNELMRNITKDEICIYPDIRSFSYPKRKSVNLLSLNNGLKNISIFKLSIRLWMRLKKQIYC